MRDRKLELVLLLTMSIALTGCFKKSSEQTNIAGTGFDSGTVSPAANDELSQLPPANSQSYVEALPVEAAPVTQAASTLVALDSASENLAALPAATTLTRDQQIQTALKNAGFYNGKIDGKLGPMSKKAIAEFQAQNGLKADGKVGPKTWAALSAHLAGPSSASALSAPAVTDAVENQ